MSTPDTGMLYASIHDVSALTKKTNQKKTVKHQKQSCFYQSVDHLACYISNGVNGAGGETRTPTSKGNQILLTNYAFRRRLFTKRLWSGLSHHRTSHQGLGGCRQVSTPFHSNLQKSLRTWLGISISTTFKPSPNLTSTLALFPFTRTHYLSLARLPIPPRPHTIFFFTSYPINLKADNYISFEMTKN